MKNIRPFNVYDPQRASCRHYKAIDLNLNHYIYILYFFCFCGRVPWLYKYWLGGFMLFVVLCPGTPEGSTGSGSGFKVLRRRGNG